MKDNNIHIHLPINRHSHSITPQPHKQRNKDSTANCSHKSILLQAPDIISYHSKFLRCPFHHITTNTQTNTAYPFQFPIKNIHSNYPSKIPSKIRSESFPFFCINVSITFNNKYFQSLSEGPIPAQTTFAPPSLFISSYVLCRCRLAATISVSHCIAV